MIPTLDIIGDVLTAIAVFFFIGIIIALVLGYILFRAISNLSPVSKGAITAGLVIIGLVLIISVVGAPEGVVALFTGIFISLFSAFLPNKETED